MATWCINSEKIIDKYYFPYHFKKISVRYEKIGYNIDVLRQTACLVANSIKVSNFQGGESRGFNDRVHGISCRYSDKTCKKIKYISTNTCSIIMH